MTLIVISSLCLGFAVGTFDWYRTNRAEAQRTSPEWTRIERQLQSLQSSVDRIAAQMVRMEAEQRAIGTDIRTLADSVDKLTNQICSHERPIKP